MKIKLYVWHPSATVALERLGYQNGQTFDNSSMNVALSIVSNIFASGLNVMMFHHNDGPDDPDDLTIAVDVLKFQQR